MKNTDPKHKHTYDAQGKMTCCSQEEKINKIADKQVKKKSKKESCCSIEHDDTKVKKIVKDQHNHDEHSDDDGHDHSGGNQTTFQMFLPAVISFVLLLIAIGFDNYFPQTWFTGWVRIS